MRTILYLLIALIAFFGAFTPSVMAGTGTIVTYGMTASGAQANLTQVGTTDNYQINTWQIGSGVKNFVWQVTAASDTLTFTLYNNTVDQIYELKVNYTTINFYQANDTGAVVFTYTQTTGNRTYNIQPATVQGGYNFTGSWFRDIVVKNGTLENVWMKNVNVVNVNVTAFNATEITGNGSGIRGLNASNITYGELPDVVLRHSGNVLFGDNTTVLRDNNASILLDTNKTILTDRNASILLNSNNSIIVKQMIDSCTGASNALGWNNSGFDCRTVGSANPSLTPQNITTSSYYTVPANVTYIYVTVWGGGGGGGGVPAAGGPYKNGGGAGGGSSEVVYRAGLAVRPNQTFMAVIGSGGDGVMETTGNDGGWSYFNQTDGELDFAVISAKPGKGGTGFTGGTVSGGYGGGYTGGINNNSASWNPLAIGTQNLTLWIRFGGSGGGDSIVDTARMGASFQNHSNAFVGYSGGVACVNGNTRWSSGAGGFYGVGGCGEYNVGNGGNAGANSGAGGGGTYTRAEFAGGKAGGGGGSGGVRIEYS